MPICTYCRTAFIPGTYMDPAEPCQCGANGREERDRDYEPTEEELWEREAMIAGLLAHQPSQEGDP